MIEHADHVIDIGPKLQENMAVKLFSEGTPKELLKYKTLTAEYLNGS